MSEEYEIKTENFEGPYDLFLFLIENKKMDFSKIVISIIIDEYLKIIDNEKNQNLKIQAQFLSMASEILEIKAYSILSQDKKEEKEKDLEKRIVEYKILKDLSIELSMREVEYNIPYRIEGKKVRVKESIEYSLEDINIDMIRSIFEELFNNKEMKERIHIQVIEEFSVEEALKEINNNFIKDDSFSFSSLFKGNFSRIRIVSFFLAILDLYKNGEIDIYQENNDFYIRRDKDVK